MKKQMILMGGDAVSALGILLLWIIGANGYVPGIFSGLWVTGFVPVLVFSSYICEVYNIRPWFFKTIMIRCAIANAASLIVLILLNKVFSIPLHMIFGVLFFFVFQILWQAGYEAASQSHFFSKNLLVIGTGPSAREVERLIESSPGKYVLSGYITTATDLVSVEENKIVGKMDDIVSLCRQYRAHAIVMALTERRGGLAIHKLVSCKLMGVRIIDYPNFYESMTGKIPVESINPSWLVQSNGFLITPLIRVMKRVFDIVLSSLVLLLTLPFFPILLILVKYKSPGPVFYFQKRVGKDGKEFIIYKFRTMGTDAESKGGAAWARENDPRVTRFGHIFRKTRIDELPQLINVLKGEMSFIGPRPERPEFVEQLCEIIPYYRERHAVKPGITGWAQVMYPYGASLGDSVEKLRYDLYYINNLSVFLELLIVFETIKVILFRRGSR
ncbi:MAG: glycosyltransferase [Desulfobacterales bacterium RIFOXYA12_FULL_46_15]|nr:MAG: glycosyltransferase [Desulfobacterales bacterium RIFOXYA12_FULL_46_15]